MPQIYNEEFRKKMVRLHLQEGRTYKSLIDEFGVSKASISKWCRDFSKECQTSSSAQNDSEIMQEKGKCILRISVHKRLSKV